MLRRFYNFLHAHRFIHYFLAGSSAFVLDFFLLIVFKEFFKLNPTAAVAYGQIFVIIYVFCVHKFFSFKSNGDTHRQLARFAALLFLNYAVSVGWMWFWIDFVGASFHIDFRGETLDVAYLAARTFNIILAVSWNFFLYKFWVYKSQGSRMDSERQTMATDDSNLAEISEK